MILSPEGSHQVLKDMIHPSQLEKRFGGNAENLTCFWPPQHNSNEFGNNPDLICSIQSNNLMEKKEEIKVENISQIIDSIPTSNFRILKSYF